MVNFPIALLFFSVGGFNLIQTRKKRYRYLKLMSPLHAAIYTTISYTLWVDYYSKNYYLTLRSKVKVPRMSLWYGTHRLMVMDLPTKYYWPISKDKNVMARTRKYYLKNNYVTLMAKVKVSQRSLRYATHCLMVMHPHTWMILSKTQLFYLEIKGQCPTKVIMVHDRPPYGHAPTYQISLSYLVRQTRGSQEPVSFTWL